MQAETSATVDRCHELDKVARKRGIQIVSVRQFCDAADIQGVIRHIPSIKSLLNAGHPPSCRKCGVRGTHIVRYRFPGVLSQTQSACVLYTIFAYDPERSTYRELTFDHILPHSYGGMKTRENGRILCRQCNEDRSNEVLDMDFVDMVIAALSPRILNPNKHSMYIKALMRAKPEVYEAAFYCGA